MDTMDILNKLAKAIDAEAKRRFVAEGNNQHDWPPQNFYGDAEGWHDSVIADLVKKAGE